MYIFMTEEEANTKVLQYENVLVTNRELHILKGPRFLNDIIIEFYFLHISNALLQSHESFRDDILLVSPALSFFLQQDFGDDSHVKDFAESNKVDSKQVVMFTVNNNLDAGRNDGGSHWSLLVYYRKSNTFVHYDSLGCNGSFAKKLFRAVKKHVATPAESSSTTGTIVRGDVDSTNTDAINIGDVDSNNTTTTNIGDVDSNNTSTINGDRDSTDTTMVADSTNTSVVDGDCTMIDGDTTNTSMMDAYFSSSSSRVGGDYTNCTGVHGHCTRFDNDENQLQRYNQKKQRMRRNWEEEDMPWRYHQRGFPRSWLWNGDYMNSRSGYTRWDRDARGFLLPRGYQYHEEDDDFKEEGCMPKQKNFYDCGLYVMEIARVVCEWYYLDDEAKQQQPEHRGFFCKLGGGGRFPNISESVHTSLESTMRDMLLSIIQQRARESGIHLDLFSSDDDESKDDDVLGLHSDENESKDDDSAPQFGSQPKYDDEETPVDSVVRDLFYGNLANEKNHQFGPQPRPQQYKSEDETLEDCGGVAAPPPKSVFSTSEDHEPEEIWEPILEDRCSLLSNSSNYLEGDDLLVKKRA